MRNDVLTGMFFSNLVMYSIILTAAATLNAHGGTTISIAREAAEALRPLAGAGAYWLFSLGLLGAGMLGVCTELFGHKPDLEFAPAQDVANQQVIGPVVAVRLCGMGPRRGLQR